MKGINFIDGISHKQYRSVARWFLYSILLISTLTGTTAYLHINQHHNLQAVQSKKQQLEQRIAQYETKLATIEQLNTQKQTYQKQLNKLTQRIDNPKLPNTLIKSIFDSLQGAQLVNCSLQKKSVRMTVEAHTNYDIKTLIQSLRNIDQVNMANLVTLQQIPNGIKAEISARVA